jgi:cell division septation protein DedD
MRDENDQKEIVLGNKQLLSIFFIVIAMLGVAFTLGYMIGRNTANVSAAGVSPVNPSIPTPSPRAASNPPVDRPPANTPVDPPAVQDSNPPDAPAPKEVAVTGTRAAKPYGDPAKAPETETAHATADPVATPAAGSPPYLQVAAMKMADAQHMVTVLRGRGFPALVGESPKEGLFRVLVGPYKDMAALVDAKQRLKAAGFDNPMIAR